VQVTAYDSNSGVLAASADPALPPCEPFALPPHAAFEPHRLEPALAAYLRRMGQPDLCLAAADAALPAGGAAGRPVFGSPLAAQARDMVDGVPIIVRRLVAAVEAVGIAQEVRPTSPLWLGPTGLACHFPPKFTLAVPRPHAGPVPRARRQVARGARVRRL